MVGMDLSKQQALHVDPKSIQQINFIWNLERQGKMFFINKKAKETVSDFSQGTVKVFKMYFSL